MKNTVKWIVIALLLVGVIAGALFLYNKYSEEFNMNNQNQQEEHMSDTEKATDQDENKLVAPNFTVTDINGNKVKLSDFKGKPVVINFWTTWCTYCKIEMPDFDDMYKEYPDIQFIMLNTTDGDTVETAKAFIEDNEYSFPIFFDSENYDASKVYNITSYPQTVFIDKDGNISSHRIGMMTLETLQEEIDKIK